MRVLCVAALSLPLPPGADVLIAAGIRAPAPSSEAPLRHLSVPDASARGLTDALDAALAACSEADAAGVAVEPLPALRAAAVALRGARAFPSLQPVAPAG